MKSILVHHLLQQPPRQQTDLDSNFDYQAPLTAHSLRSNSRWLIVRRNLHRIRYMGLNNVETTGGMQIFI